MSNHAQYHKISACYPAWWWSVIWWLEGCGRHVKEKKTCSLVFYLYQLLGLGVYNLCDRQKNMSVEQNEDWSTRRKACPITTLSTKNYMESKAGLRDTEECEIFVLLSANHPKFSQNFPPKNVPNMRKWSQHRVEISKSICCMRHTKCVWNVLSFYSYFWNWKDQKK